jgi:hypothetical protein
LQKIEKYDPIGVFQMASNTDQRSPNAERQTWTSVRVGTEWPRLFEAFGIRIVMRRTDLHVFVLRIIDFVLNPALQGPVVARARRQLKDDHGPKSDEQSEQMNFHSALEMGPSAASGLPVARKPNEGQWTHQKSLRNVNRARAPIKISRIPGPVGRRLSQMITLRLRQKFHRFSTDGTNETGSESTSETVAAFPQSCQCQCQ